MDEHADAGVPTTMAGARRRLRGGTQRRGTHSGFPVWGALLFGGVFVAAGTAITLVGLRLLPVDPAGVHAPWWVLTVCGLCFAGAGLMVWGMAATQLRAGRHRRAAARGYGHAAVMRDHPWDPRGYTPPRWGPAFRGLLGAGFLTLFMSMFNWWAWVAGGPWPVKLIVSVFDLIIVFLWWSAALAFARAVRFGGSRLAFSRFPCPLDEPVSVRWIPPRGISGVEKGSVTFRCVEEYWEESGSGKNRSRSLVHDELCAETHSFDRPQPFREGRAVEFRFTPPSGAPSTQLSAARPVFWELEVKLARPGLDFHETYLVPVYGA
jgi:hypothetical protein